MDARKAMRMTMYAGSRERPAGASGRVDEISTRESSSRGRPGERVVRGGGRDLRLAPEGSSKVGVRGGTLGELAHGSCRDLVLAATRGWSSGAAVNRHAVAQRLGVSEGVLNRMMSPGDDLAFRDGDLLVLVAAEDLVPEEARFAVGAAIASECGGVFVPLAGGGKSSCDAHPSVNAAVMGLASAAGRVAELVREARC